MFDRDKIQGLTVLFRQPFRLFNMLVSFSVILPLLWGITVGNETLKPLQYVALAFLFLAIILTNADKLKDKKSEQENYGLWLTFIAITFVCNGVCSILQKQHQTLYPGAYNGEFMLFAMLLCSIVFTFSAFKEIPLTQLKEIKGKRYGILSGLANGIANFLTLALASLENASILFPILSAGTILGSLLCGKILFKET